MKMKTYITMNLKPSGQKETSPNLHYTTFCEEKNKKSGSNLVVAVNIISFPLLQASSSKIILKGMRDAGLSETFHRVKIKKIYINCKNTNYGLITVTTKHLFFNYGRI